LGRESSISNNKEVHVTTTVEYIQETEFDTCLRDNPLVVLDCTATWCGPCKMVSHFMDKLAQEYQDRAKIVKLDVGDNPTMAEKLGIRSLPTVIFFKDGQPSETIVGVVGYEKFTAAVEKIL
jgi:thioredoxin 1